MCKCFPLYFLAIFVICQHSVEEVVLEVSNGRMETEMRKALCSWLFVNAKGQILCNNVPFYREATN